jgi:hypothetical protein
VAAVLGDRTDLEVKMRWLTKFNHILPMLPKPTRIAYQNEKLTAEKDQPGKSGLMDYHPVNDCVWPVNLRDEWLSQSSGPWDPDPAQNSRDWTWQQ